MQRNLEPSFFFPPNWPHICVLLIASHLCVTKDTSPIISRSFSITRPARWSLFLSSGFSSAIAIAIGIMRAHLIYLTHDQLDSSSSSSSSYYQAESRSGEVHEVLGRKHCRLGSQSLEAVSTQAPTHTLAKRPGQARSGSTTSTQDKPKKVRVRKEEADTIPRAQTKSLHPIHEIGSTVGIVMEITRTDRLSMFPGLQKGPIRSCPIILKVWGPIPANQRGKET